MVGIFEHRQKATTLGVEGNCVLLAESLVDSGHDAIVRILGGEKRVKVMAIGFRINCKNGLGSVTELQFCF